MEAGASGQCLAPVLQRVEMELRVAGGHVTIRHLVEEERTVRERTQRLSPAAYSHAQVSAKCRLIKLYCY